MKRLSLTILVAAIVVGSACCCEAGIFRSARRAACSGGSCPAPTYYSTGQGQYYAPAIQVQAPVTQVDPATLPTRQFVYPVYYSPTPAQAETPQAMQSAPAAVQYVADDSSGTFVNWINSVRAARGLRALVWSPVLAADAVINSSRGFGHSFMGRARRQNAGWGSLSTVQTMWLQSPAHASAIFDPSVTEVGLGQAGNIITLNLR